MAKGWLDNYGKQENYNNSKTSVPEGFEGEGYSMKGRNYSPAWGGQFQLGGSVYPVNYVPEAAMGGSIPGAVGFSYARTQSPAPSNGKYAKKTMASAQNGIVTESTFVKKPKIGTTVNELINKKGSEAKRFLNQWMNSPMYTEMAKHSDPDNYQNLTNWRKHNLQTANIHYNPNQLSENSGGRSDNVSGNVTIFPEGKNLDDVEVHEFSHSSDRPQLEINRHKRAIPQRDIDLMEKYKKSNAPDVNDDWINYVTDPSETRARLNSIRQQAKKQGVYDPFKEKITIDQYKKLLETNSSEDGFNPLHQLKNAYRDTQIINLLNSVSQNEQSQQETPIAQNGQEMKYYQEGLDFKPKTISKDGAWLDNYDEAQAGKKVVFDPKKFAKDQKANTPLQRSINKESNDEDRRRMYDTKEYQDWVKTNKIKKDKAIIQDRKDRIKNSEAAQKKSFTKDNWRQQLADETQATGDKFRMFPEDPDSFVDEWMNPGVMIGNMASDLGSAPLRAQQEDSYMPYVTSIGVPLLTGGLEGLGAKTNKQFISNLANPFNIVPGYKSAERAIGQQLGNVRTSIAPELRQGLRTAGPSFNSSELFDLNNVRKPSGSIGNQGATSEGANKILQSLGIEVKGATPNEVTLKEMVEHLKNNPKDASKYKKFLEKEPISVSELPGGEYHINDGHHRATLSYYSGNESIPSIIKNKGEYIKQEDGGIIKDDRGQWDHPGEITEIDSNDITMEGVPYDVLGISDTGDTKLMKPGKNYKFKGKKVTEYPMAQNGLRQEQKGLQNLDNLTNFTNYNKPQPGGWLNKYN
jgi:hypothetical protein